MSEQTKATTPAGRPGTGGRRKAPAVLTQTAATADLMELLDRPPEVRRFGSSRMLVFEYDARGDGMIVARLSDRDIQNGETALGQVHSALEGAKRLGLRPRLIVVTTSLSGGNYLKDRPDLNLVEEEILATRCRWVWFRGVDRIARRQQVFYTFAELLESSGVDLYLTDIPGRPVDWQNDEVHLGFDTLMSSRERRQIYERTHGPLIRRWLNEGRGWPGGLPFGFRRNTMTKYPEIDPAQWRFVRMIFELYACHEDGEGGGVRGVQKTLSEAGCELSRGTILRILSRSTYFTGEWTTTRAGHTIENRPIEIPEKERISPELWERVQNLRKLRRGKDRRTAPGRFALNRIGELADGTRIRARVTSDDPAEIVYYRPYVPDRGGSIPTRWRGWKVEASTLEGAIFDELLRVADCYELQEEWTRIARPDFGQPTRILDDAARADLDRRVDNIASAIAQVERQFALRLAEQGATDNDDLFEQHKKLLGPLEAEKRGMEEQLRRADALESMRKSTRPRPDASLVEALRELLMHRIDDEPELITKRTAFLEQALSKVVIDISDDDQLLVTLHGPLVPADLPLLEIHDPVTVLRDDLEELAVRDASSDQPTHKGCLTGQLVALTLPPLGARNARSRSVVARGSNLAPAWLSPVLRSEVRPEPKPNERPPRLYHEWDVVLRICELRLLGWSMERIAVLLNDECVPTPRGATWSAANISAHLSVLRRRSNLPPEVEAALRVRRVPRVRAA